MRNVRFSQIPPDSGQSASGPFQTFRMREANDRIWPGADWQLRDAESSKADIQVDVGNVVM